MNRYLLSFFVGVIALFAFLSISNGREVLRRAGDASRESISTNPSSAAETANLTGIESAGENVLRQTSPEAIERSQTLTDTATTPSTVQQLNGTTQSPANTTQPTPAAQTNQPSTNATPPVPPSTTPPPTTTPQPAPAVPPTDQDPIPALW